MLKLFYALRETHCWRNILWDKSVLSKMHHIQVNTVNLPVTTGLIIFVFYVQLQKQLTRLQIIWILCAFIADFPFPYLPNFLLLFCSVLFKFNFLIYAILGLGRVTNITSKRSDLYPEQAFQQAGRIQSCVCELEPQKHWMQRHRVSAASGFWRIGIVI